MCEQDWGGRGAHETANLAATPPVNGLRPLLYSHLPICPPWWG